MGELIEVMRPHIAWFIIGLMCGASLENWARRSYHGRFGKADIDDDSAS